MSMLSRLKLKPRVNLFSRCFSEKPPGKDVVSTGKRTQSEEEKKSSTEKIQNLLKSMMATPIISDSEYREKFATAPERIRKPKPDEIEIKTEKIEENITKVASEVAQAIGGNVKQTEAELLSKVLGKINQTSTSLSDLIVGMKVDRSQDSDENVKAETRGQQVKRLVEKSKQTSPDSRYSQPKEPRAKFEETRKNQERKSVSKATTLDIFNSPPLGIFKAGEANYGVHLDVWDRMNERELSLATSQPPSNYFQKMVLWTEQGKVWKFPINNEQGMDEEQNVHFSEHVFLDAHLEGWCPTRGPIRHFMELVCVGLSKNAFYTVQEKKDHIMWYKEYFESKKDLLKEVGAWEMGQIKEAAT